ncbi:MAG: selenocysteine-specific translation elongation factor [Candidatus Latescibacteria bacterium]|nr:selenocysteine-specific translation elongation factor [Candidatus Latescibacterota bacterium]
MPSSEMHTIIGTAGHIDHGKTLLVKALTGMDTDTAPEEKARGITIELGFAFLGDQATLIDVPGHERFVKTMVAGVSTIDIALLVVAADDGVMPQTREHLDVLQLLGIERGLIALNKTDLVEEDWLALVEEDLRQLVKGTFLEGAPIARVSAHTGAGVDALKQLLLSLMAQTRAQRQGGPFRLWVDRAFLVKGFGLVCTGTVWSGTLQSGDHVELAPAGRSLRVRGLQQHGREVDQVQAGDRAALNLPGVETGQIVRGDALVAPQYFRPTQLLDVRLRLLPSCPKVLETRSRVRLHLGTAEVMARVVLLEGQTLEPGSSALAQLRLEAPLVAAWGDCFVIRRYSPPLTIGGGRILDPQPIKHRRNEAALREHLGALEQENPRAVAEAMLRLAPEGARPCLALAGELGLGLEQLEEVLGALGGKIVRVQLGGLPAAIHVTQWNALRQRAEETLAAFHQAQPLKAGPNREELRSLADRRVAPELFDQVLQDLERKGRIAGEGAVVRAASHQIRFSAEEETLRQRLLDALNRSSLAEVPDAEGLAKLLQLETRKVDTLLKAVMSLGAVVPLEGGLFLHAQALERVRAQLRCYLQEQGSVTVAAFRDLLGANRRWSLALLAHFDREGLTQRQGDLRVLCD